MRGQITTLDLDICVREDIHIPSKDKNGIAEKVHNKYYL